MLKKITTEKGLLGLFLCIFLLNFHSSKAQFALPQKKLSSLTKLSSNIPKIVIKEFNNDSLFEAINIRLEKPTAFALALKADIALNKTGVTDILPDGNVVWRVQISSPTALGYKIACDSFFLPKGASLYFYSPDKKHVYGAYTHLNNNSNKTFATGSMYGNNLIIEINCSQDIFDEIQFHIDRISYRYVPYNSDHFGNSLDCHNNVNCSPWINDWCNEIRSTIKFEYLGVDDVWRACSGVLVNNSFENFDPILITSAHCGQTNAAGGIIGKDPHQWVVYFNFQSPNCNPNEIGNDEMRTVGIDTIGHVFSAICPDIGMLRITETRYLNYNVYFAGWNLVQEFPDLPSEDVTIFHHPRGDGKKVTEGTLYRPFDPLDPKKGTECWYGNFTNGILEPGSSGSPVFDINHRIIGITRGGESEPDCETKKFNSGILGRAATSHENASSESAAWDWPLVMGDEMEIDGIDPLGSCQPVIELIGKFFPGNDWQNKNEIIIQAGNSITAAPNNESTVITASPLYMWPNPTTPLHQSNYVFRAGNSISLKQGFSVEAGNQFRAELGSCLDFDGCGFNHASRLGNVEMQETLQESHLSIFPNPTANRINIAFNEDFCYTLLSIEGKYLGKKDCSINQKASLYTESLPSGVYLLKIEGSKDVYFKKFVKQ